MNTQYHYRLIRTLVRVLLAAFALLVTARHAQAFDGETCSVTYQDADQDGRADSVILDCSPGFATDHDRITIYTGDRQMDANRPWQQNVNFENEVWVFDVGALERASLVVIFQRDGNMLTADLYDDQDGDGQVAYTLRDGQPIVFETPYWTVRVVADEAWWMKDGKINYNLTLMVDGPVLVTYGSEMFVDRLSTDGDIDYEVVVDDRDEDGRPDYELRNASPPVPESWGVYRSILIASSREGDNPIENFILWPYLGSSGPLKGYEGGKLPTTIFYDAQGRAYGIVKNYGASFPPVQVDWSNARINYVGEFVASHGSDKNWYIESISSIRLGELSAPNFENPFAFYDLAADGDEIPELQIRVQYFGPNDPYYLDGRHPMAYENVRYSWDQDNDQTWDYKVDLVGRHVEDTVVAFPEFSVHTIPYERLPYWVTEKAWDVAAFVSWETGKTWGTEGIYEWGGSHEMERYYIPGLGDTPPITDYNTIAEGFRGDYKFESGRQPMLYFSSLDHKLHLLNAEAGVWNIDGDTEVRYANLDNDAYLDQWQYLEAGGVRRQLNLAEDYLVYVGDRQMLLKQVDLASALFETLPPRNHEEWLALRQQLERHQREFGPSDLRAMATQFEGPEWRVEGAWMRDLRPDDGGFRFVLELSPGFQVSGTGGPEVSAIPPGAYVVTYRDSFSIKPLTPPDLSLTVQWPETEDLELGRPVLIRVQAMNDGLEDTNQVTLVAVARHADESVEFARKTLDVLSGEPVQIALNWKPVMAGEWKLDIRMENMEGAVMAEAQQLVNLMGGQQENVRAFLVLSTGNAWCIPAIPVLFAFAVLTCLAVRIIHSDGRSRGAL